MMNLNQDALRDFMNVFSKLLGKKELSNEAFEAYYYRLPAKVNVSWFRDGEMIVGDVVADRKKYPTQGYNPEEFIDMVNDVLYAQYSIPAEYYENVKQFNTYSPNKDEFALLRNKKIPRSKLNLKRNEDIIKLA